MDKRITDAERLIILEIGYERHETEMREIRTEIKILKTTTDKLVKTNLEIRNWIMGGTFVLVAENIGIFTMIAKFFK